MNKYEENRNNDIMLKLLDELTREPLITQRTLSSRLDIALGLVNTYIKRLAKKGHIKVSTIPKNRVKYILTPKGFAEKVRLTYEYMHYSINYFKDIRLRIDDIYRQMIASDVKDLLLWGDGEVAELCYLSLRGLPLNLVGVVDSKKVEKGFFGHNVYSFGDFPELNYDAILITSFNEEEMERIKNLGVNVRKIYSL